MGTFSRNRGRPLRAAVFAATIVLALSPARLAAGSGALWAPSISATNTVVSSPTSGGGYPENPPVAGGCVGPSSGNFNANHSESELTVKPGSEQIVGSSKFFFDKFSTGYNFYLGSYNINGTQHSNNIIQGYDCSTTETTPGVLNQSMPPSWTNTTDPNVGFDSRGRVYQTMLPFNAFWTNLHPDGEITVSYSDDLGAHWVTGNGGQALEQVPNASSFQFGFVEDKQWIAVNHIAGNPFQDHVYSTWDVINGTTVKLRLAVSRDRGQTFSPATTIASASVDQLRNQFSQTGIDANGNLYVAYANIGNKTSLSDFFVMKSSDDGNTFSTPVLAGSGSSIGVASGRLTNTTFRDGIPFAMAVSPDQPGHVYVAYNDFNGTQYNVFLVQSTDGGQTWSRPVPVNDDIASGRVADHFQPEVAAGTGGAVAVAFYDRRASCPADASIIKQDRGRSNFCIDVSVQPYEDSGSGATAVGANIRASNYTWDPQQPGLLVNLDGSTTDLQTLGGLGQMACASHNDPCRLSFIGDYFGLAISAGNIYTLSVSTHYSSKVKADDGSGLYYQQQVLGTISRAGLGI
ncbi:MAG TPA: sialidase family protein [Candidatus Dormibacteraeota bacterium]|nr:sialidase family protein [Candidatus Dormibacteraeota bacterium]